MKYNIKYKGMYFLFDLVGIISILILFVKNRGVGGLLNGQNLLGCDKIYLLAVPKKVRSDV